MYTAEELTNHLAGCACNERESQKAIYVAFYGYALAVCDRYTEKQGDALEILNDGFLKVFKEIGRFEPFYDDVYSSFKGWLRKIMVYTAIDHYRKYQKHKLVSPMDDFAFQLPAIQESALDKLGYDEIIRAVQELPPSYRTVFNLVVIEGMHHEEVARLLGISIGTSKSNLFKAKKHLQKKLIRDFEIHTEKNAI